MDTDVSKQRQKTGHSHELRLLGPGPSSREIRGYTSEGGTRAPGDNHTSSVVSLKNSLHKHTSSQEPGSVSRGVPTASEAKGGVRSRGSGARSWGATDTSPSFDESGPFG